MANVHVWQWGMCDRGMHCRGVCMPGACMVGVCAPCNLSIMHLMFLYSVPTPNENAGQQTGDKHPTGMLSSLKCFRT